ncbi:Type 1 glutamine amidotransferase-like domain-containing protein [Halobacillus sp. GSS1]|uniref:Type 1 glutamine amidotransferase-like domain-containing protein n=1 Tax=Halobacillus sp. GSS1 TaxID=2815919 RepID=UPI001A8CB2CA|nr:Type 1 glutamine amidotransferase-like domain-containing protein [Halobacillus sp. GSS1]MBN9656472.1 Type 1 glutamine amidotransferase-like domain-containing protein [Halobacillus sp. GSS1]
MGTLILSGGGSAKQNKEAHKTFAERLDKDKPLLYIPVAGDSVRRPHEGSFHYIKKCLNPYGVTKFEMWTDLNDHSVKEIQTFAGIYISGGCSLKLRRLVGESGFARVLSEFYKRGGIIFGQSAGAILLGNNRAGIHEGLNLVENHRIWCHYKSEMEGERSFLSDKESSRILAMEDGGSVLVTNDRLIRISGNSYTFQEGRKTSIE